jgi:hypothetical protein
LVGVLAELIKDGSKRRVGCARLGRQVPYTPQSRGPASPSIGQ